MNTATITGTVATEPTSRTRGFVPTTDFDVAVTTGRRTYTLHVQALNAQAKIARRYVVGDQVAVTGYINSEAFDMPDRSIWYRVKIVADELEHHPAANTDALGADK